MRKITSLILVLILTFSLVSCNSAKSVEGIISPVPQDEKPELTIVFNSIEYRTLTNTEAFSEYINKFEDDFGVEIKLEKIMTNAGGLITPEQQSQYMQKLSTKLLPKDGPELIFTEYMPMEALIEQHAVQDVRGKIDNLSNIYDSLLGDKVYYVPLGLHYYALKIREDALKEMNLVEPALAWTSKDYYAIRDQWISQNQVWFSPWEYYMVFTQFIDLESLYKDGDSRIYINTQDMRQKINDVRNYIFGGRYKLIRGYKYENYYNMVFEGKSQEYKDGRENYLKNNDNGHIDAGLAANIFRAKEMDWKSKSFGTIMYPQFKDNEMIIESYGFLVNKNGKNLDLAYEFINGLLSDEVQMDMFESESRYYPVNKNIEADILKLEADGVSDPRVIEVKSYALQQLKDGQYDLWITSGGVQNIRWTIEMDLTKFILADNPYSDEQLKAELKRLEDKYNVWLSE